MAKLKLSDYVARFIKEKDIHHVFVLSGGASVHLIQSISDSKGVAFICPQHEQACAMAADGYARATGGFGVAISTSGPGATNLLTGVACSYYDSVPTLFITGQVATFRSRGNTGVRQIGFQETDTVEIFKPVTKYSARIDDPRAIRFELEKACFLALEGRPGPVLIDIPDNIQRELIDPDQLEGFTPPLRRSRVEDLEASLAQLLGFIEQSKRPVLILGWGVRLSKCEDILRSLIEELSFPVVPTWAVADFLPASNLLSVGTFGTHGTRYANFTVQNADLVIALGSRLDTKATGSPASAFARDAKKVVIDIDEKELGKFAIYGVNVDLLIHSDAGEFIRMLRPRLTTVIKPDLGHWRSKIKEWKDRYPTCARSYFEEEGINPYVFVKTLSELSKSGDIFVVDTGCAIAWMMQAFEFKENQRLLHDWNNTAMGWALPASIGASLAKHDSQVTCVVGDGSILMNIQELATIVRYNLPVKILVLDNNGYSMIRQTQDQWLQSQYLASSHEGGLPTVDFVRVAQSFGIDSFEMDKNADLRPGLQRVRDNRGPLLCNVKISEDHRVVPQVKYGRPNEDAEPLLPREEFFRNMLVKPLQVSLHELEKLEEQ